jgi:hypothetical protein
MKTSFIFEYPNDYWQQTPENQQLINKWVDKLIVDFETEGNKIKFHAIPPGSKLYTIDVFDGDEF